MAYRKWIQMLIYIGIISLVNSVIGYIPFIPASISTWISRGIMAATVYCMFRLSFMNGRYLKAAIFRAVMLGCSLITSFLFGSYLLSIAASIFSILAVYQECAAHAEVVAEKDQILSRRWRYLFHWEFLAAVILSFGSSVATLILISSALQPDVSGISSIVIVILKIPQFMIHVVRLLYLKRMLMVFS